MVGLLAINWFTLCLFSLHCTLAHSLVCNSQVYGTPVLADCVQAVRKVTLSQYPRQLPARGRIHIFAEPQFMIPSFGGISNPFHPDAIVQLPKLWRHNSCHITLMSEAQPGQTGVISPHFTASWNDVIDQFVELSRCLGEGKGGYKPFNLTNGQHAAAMYLYTSDSTWGRNTVNTYMSDGRPVMPHTQPNQYQPLGNVSSSGPPNLLSNYTNLIDTTSSTPPASIKPLAPGELVLQDKI